MVVRDEGRCVPVVGECGWCQVLLVKVDSLLGMWIPDCLKVVEIRLGRSAVATLPSTVVPIAAVMGTMAVAYVGYCDEVVRSRIGVW